MMMVAVDNRDNDGKNDDEDSYDDGHHRRAVSLLGRLRGSVVRVGYLNAEDLGSNLILGLLSGFVPGDPNVKFITLCI